MTTHYSAKDSVFGIVDPNVAEGGTQVVYAFALDGAAYTDESTAMQNVTVNDMTLYPAVEEVGDAYYFGAAGKFSGIWIVLGTAGVGTATTWEYYNGSSWVTLTISDQTVGFTAVAGTYLIAFDPPSAWATTTINGQSAYWIRARCSTASYTTQPKGTQAWLIKDLGPYIISIDGIPGPRELSETTALGDAGRTFIPALENSVITIELQWSEDVTSGPDHVLGILRTYTAAVHFHYGPEGRATGDIKYYGTCWVRNFTIMSRVGAQVTARAELQVQGQVSRSTFT